MIKFIKIIEIVPLSLPETMVNQFPGMLPRPFISTGK
jgi:hypothetical protein